MKRRSIAVLTGLLAISTSLFFLSTATPASAEGSDYQGCTEESDFDHFPDQSRDRSGVDWGRVEYCHFGGYAAIFMIDDTLNDGLCVSLETRSGAVSDSEVCDGDDTLFVYVPLNSGVWKDPVILNLGDGEDETVACGGVEVLSTSMCASLDSGTSN